MRALTLAAMAATAITTAAAADPVADFYKGKTINIIVSTGEGGTYDTVARSISRYMSKHIPGEPTMILKYMPGAGHIKATEYMYSVATKDGTNIATIGNSIPQTQVFEKASLESKGVHFDVRKFNWLGSTGISNLMTAAWAASGVKTIDDAYKQEVTAGSTGAGSGTMLYPTITNNVVGTRFKIIAGYRKATEIDLAMERGEVVVRAGFSLGSLSTEHPDWISEKKVNFLFQVGGEREPSLPDVPLMSDLGKTDEQKLVMRVLSSPVSLGRPYLTTPELPADRLAALRTAFSATMKDPEFLAEAKKLKFDLRPIDGDQVTRIIKETVDLPPDVVDKAKAAIGNAGGTE
ncbi:MAG TPA: tripartite tricarboxylate transporter substrate-binding protein [Alphaproteobacteria bacterium]|jgi:tripartite-type tricarboxylate transporter receptor subunit TctC|nr:tripartite tricarboxylate transporter substrate-binding protein [Alphaproteobacteria bacterium]